jgi:hygromycin-B 7''-O-kinase
VDAGERDGWPWLVMTQLAGEPLTRAWPSMTEAQRCSVLAQIGAVAAEVHALAPDPVLPLAPDWDVFVARQRAGCRQRQERTGLPAQLLARLEAFVGGELPAGRPVMLTGEYTPMNLLSSGGRLAAMFDFGDGLVGPGAYDWLGPLCFLAAGSAPRCRAFFDGYGASPEPGWQQGALRLLLLHRYSHLKAQLALPGWERAPSFEALAHALWPVG